MTKISLHVISITSWRQQNFAGSLGPEKCKKQEAYYGLNEVLSRNKMKQIKIENEGWGSWNNCYLHAG
jgi:hypothetical protein